MVFNLTPEEKKILKGLDIDDITFELRNGFQSYGLLEEIKKNTYRDIAVWSDGRLSVFVSGYDEQVELFDQLCNETLKKRLPRYIIGSEDFVDEYYSRKYPDDLHPQIPENLRFVDVFNNIYPSKISNSMVSVDWDMLGMEVADTQVKDRVVEAVLNRFDFSGCNGIEEYNQYIKDNKKEEQSVLRYRNGGFVFE